jgi:hypothetical protein
MLMYRTRWEVPVKCVRGSQTDRYRCASLAGLPYGAVLGVGGFFFGIIGFSLLKKSKMLKDFLPASDDGSASGGNFGTSHEPVPVDEEGGNMRYMEENGEPYVLSSQAVFVQVLQKDKPSFKFLEWTHTRTSMDARACTCLHLLGFCAGK